MKKIYLILLAQVGKRGLCLYAFLTLVSGISGLLFFQLVSQMISEILNDNYKTFSIKYLILFMGIIALSVWVRSVLSLLVIKVSQNIFWTLRREFLCVILKSNYQIFIKRKNQIYSTLGTDLQMLTQASVNTVSFLTSVFLIIGCFIYLLLISKFLFIITLVTASVGGTIYHQGARKNRNRLEKARDLENEFMEKFNSILNGFKEITLEPRKGQFIYENNIIPISKKAFKFNISAFTSLLNYQITGQILFYILITAVVFCFSIYSHIESEDIVKVIFILLYLLASIEGVIAMLPSLLSARVSANKLSDLQKDLVGEQFSDISSTTFNPLNEYFRELCIKDLRYSYSDSKENFRVGPIDMKINRSEVVFIFGGNGSGKTTFIQTILGLNVPFTGNIQFNGLEVNPNNINHFRSNFSVVFSDFYLFDEVLSNEPVLLEKWNYYIDLFGLKEKVSLRGNKFSTIDLSIGQRKRLALVSALLEEKPILIIDEWAADQDPEFRDIFYTVIIPKLKADGLTIMAITHDDKYYQYSDKLYKMENGLLFPQAKMTVN